MMSLIKQTFVLDPLDKDLIAVLFKTIGSFLDTGLPIYRISYPHKHDRMQEVKNEIGSLVTGIENTRQNTY